MMERLHFWWWVLKYCLELLKILRVFLFWYFRGWAVKLASFGCCCCPRSLLAWDVHIFNLIILAIILNSFSWSDLFWREGFSRLAFFVAPKTIKQATWFFQGLNYLIGWEIERKLSQFYLWASGLHMQNVYFALLVYLI